MSMYQKNVWYIDIHRQLTWGSVFYAMYFVVSFPNVFRLDEEPAQPTWSISRCIIEASFVSITSLLLLDLWTQILGPLV